MTAAAPKPRRRRRWWHVYFALLIASFAVQFFWPKPPAPGPNDLTVEVQSANGEPVRIAYRDAGAPNPDAKTLILLHGSPGSADNFNRLIPLLGPHFRVIAIDLPGFGKSSRRVPDYSIRAHARYVLAFIDTLDIERAAVLGYSMGSGVALEMTALQPRRIDGLIFYGGIGIQEGEGSGDYHFEHFKYAIGYAAMVVAPELVPHFGLLGPRATRHAFLRNFIDTDQRPLRSILENLDTPLLILHGRSDPLVPAWTARQHHKLVEHSRLVMFDASHFMVFFDDGARQLADEIIPFVERHAGSDIKQTRSTVDPWKDEPQRESPLPWGLDLRRGMSPWTQMGVIIVGTYILEDPTTVFTGLMIRAGQVDWFVGVLALFIGIFTGDLGLYLIGWVVGRRALRWKPVAKRLPVRHIDRLGGWFDRHGFTAVVTSRFVPGTRLPLYVAAGALGRKPGRFALWTCLAVLIWAPVMLLLVVLLGDVAASPFKLLFGEHWLALVAAIVFIIVLLRLLVLLPTRIGRAKLVAKVSRLWRWEFWPLWLFYLPVLPWIGWLSLRHGGFQTITAANPAMPDGGFLDESKIDILMKLPAEWIVPSALVTGVDELRAVMAERGWAYPLILKPNTGQRGYGVKRVRSDEDVNAYFNNGPNRVLAQTFHPGPYEAGVFYYRVPDESDGRIFSITDKFFPVLEGDGRHTVEQLIYRHRRFRMQANTYLKRHGDERDRVLAEGETLPLVVAGNHCQGAEFRDGPHLVTPELTGAIDTIAKQYDGFYFGRFDVRYADPEQLKAGLGFKVIELNGVTSESTNIYDPNRSLFAAYRTLYRQWSIAFRIGAINRKRGAAVTPITTLLRTARRHYRSRSRALALAD